MKSIYEVKAESIKVADGIVLTKEAEDIIQKFVEVSKKEQAKKFSDPSMSLCLVPFENGQDDVTTFQEGMYSYHSVNPYAEELFSILEELTSSARPMMFTREDIYSTFTSHAF